MSRKVLIVDDEEQFRFGLSTFLKRHSFEVVEASSCATAETLFRRERPQLVLLDLQLPDGEGLTLLERLRRLDESASFFILSGHGTIDFAVRAVKQGAVDFFTKPVALKEVAAALDRASPSSASSSSGAPAAKPAALTSSGVRRGPSSLIGESPVMARLFEQVARLHQSDCTVLVLGETGTGKSVLARYIHDSSPRSEGAFTDLNCASLNRDFLEAELFGHERGAFTGAHAAKPGLFEAAHGGTLFLDEIGDIDATVQPKVLKVLEEKKYRRMGDVKERVADVRLISATHRDLTQSITAGTFRSDLYYRISTVFLTVPPLRERGDDVLLLADFFLARVTPKQSSPAIFSADARTAILRHRWPGNVRELRNVVERSFLMSDGRVITAADLRFDPGSFGGDLDAALPALGDFKGSTDAPRPKKLEQMEKEHILQAILDAGGRIEIAAASLGLARSTLYAKIKQYGLTPAKPPS